MKRLSTWAIRIFVAAAAFAPGAALAQQGYLASPTQGAGINNLSDFIAAFLKAVVEISLPILTLFIVYAGFMFVTARGNQKKLEDAKHNFFYVIMGAILILGAWVLATLIAATATQVLGS